MKTLTTRLIVWLISICICFSLQASPKTVLTDNNSLLKSVLYDFDGLTIGDNDLPDGDYSIADLTYAVSATPGGSNDMLGDRVLKLQLNWQSGVGEFGKATSRFFELNSASDKLNFYILNPTQASLPLKVLLTEDDDDNNYFEFIADDRWFSIQDIQPSEDWQLISIPLSAFQDENSGGNGIFDASYTGPGGMLFSISFIFQKATENTSDTYYIDMITFTEGNMPHGNNPLTLPLKSAADFCELGALAYTAQADQIPFQVESIFNHSKKIKYVNWFLYYANSGTTPNVYPGPEVENLLQNGYQPIITWEMMYYEYPRLHPSQPRLDKILNGSFDAYIDAFADKVKTYNGQIILRIFHEFEGDWYPWSLTENGKDPQVYISAFRYVVDRFRARGANNVKWMWCLNADTKPWLRYNWVIAAYPGDDYVDIVATDLYNHPNLGIPQWKSFRFTAAESYYYLRKYFPHKPLYITEVGCRERYPSEDQSSQSKGDWLCMMDKDLQSFFCHARALVFFSVLKEHDWRLNSTAEAQAAVQTCIWNDTYYGNIVGFGESLVFENSLRVYPNPFNERLQVEFEKPKSTVENFEITIYDISGKIMFCKKSAADKEITVGSYLPSGMYIIEISENNNRKRVKIIKS